MSPTLLVLMLLTPVVLSDWRERRIPNILLLGSLVVSFGLAVTGASTPLSPMDGAARWVAGLGAGLLCFLPMYLLGAMGAGDVKLMAACGACMGPSMAWEAALFALILGGVMALAWKVWAGLPQVVLWQPLVVLWSRINALVSQGTPSPMPAHGQGSTPLEKSAARLPFSLPILLASISVVSISH